MSMNSDGNVIVPAVVVGKRYERRIGGRTGSAESTEHEKPSARVGLNFSQRHGRSRAVDPQLVHRFAKQRGQPGAAAEHQPADDDRQRDPLAEGQRVEIDREDVPQRREAEEIAVVGLGLDLRGS